MYAKIEVLEIQNSEFRSNIAAQIGGAIYAILKNFSALNSSFIENTAATGGGV